MDYGNCGNQTKNKIITADENGRKFIIQNSSEKLVNKVKIDGCFFKNPSEGKRCDYLFEIENPITKVIYLELKGSDIDKAYNQLIATIETFKDDHLKCIKECHIVASRVPRAGPKIQQLQVKMRNDKKAQLIVNTTQATITI